MTAGLPGILERDREWGDATPGSGPAWDHDQLAEAYLLAGMDRRALLVAAYGLRDQIVRALSTERHKLIRAAPEGVACTCGQYDDGAHGIEASELWRRHLIDAALAVLPPEVAPIRIDTHRGVGA